MKCPDCGSDNIEGALFCEDCGVKLAPETAQPPQPEQDNRISCAQCGVENPASDIFCQGCGAALAQSRSGSESPVPPMPAVNGPKLTIPSRGRDFPLTKEVTSIGRTSPADGIYPDVDLTDDDPEAFISRRHAQIVKELDTFMFEDLGSSNGSFVNEERTLTGKRYPLKGGDILKIGKTELIFTGS